MCRADQVAVVLTDTNSDAPGLGSADPLPTQTRIDGRQAGTGRQQRAGEEGGQCTAQAAQWPIAQARVPRAVRGRRSRARRNESSLQCDCASRACSGVHCRCARRSRRFGRPLPVLPASPGLLAGQSLSSCACWRLGVGVAAGAATSSNTGRRAPCMVGSSGEPVVACHHPGLRPGAPCDGATAPCAGMLASGINGVKKD